MSEFKKFKRSAIAEMTAVTEKKIEEFRGTGNLLAVGIYGNNSITVSISDVDRSNGSPKLGDMIARNPKDHNDQWLVAEKYFKDNFESVFVPEVMMPSIPEGETAGSMSKKINNTFQHDGMKKDSSTSYISEMKDNGFDFGHAIAAAKAGKKVARAGWNGSEMFAYFVPASEYPAHTGVAMQFFGEGNSVPYRAYWALKTAQGDVATWAPSGSDSLAEDWMIVD